MLPGHSFVTDCIEISVFADKAPAGIVKSTFPSSLVIDPPEGPIVFVILVPTGVPTAVTAGVPESLPVVSTGTMGIFGIFGINEDFFTQPFNKTRLNRKKQKRV